MRHLGDVLLGELDVVHAVPVSSGHFGRVSVARVQSGEAVPMRQLVVTVAYHASEAGARQFHITEPGEVAGGRGGCRCYSRLLAPNLGVVGAL